MVQVYGCWKKCCGKHAAVAADLALGGLGFERFLALGFKV